MRRIPLNWLACGLLLWWALAEGVCGQDLHWEGGSTPVLQGPPVLLVADFSDAKGPAEPAAIAYTAPFGIVMLVLLFAAFFAMTRYDVPLPLAMSLVACAFLGMQGAFAPKILQSGFMHFADIVILFTAVGIPAHMIERSQGFKWVAAYFGYQFGRLRLAKPRLANPLLVFVILLVTYVIAGLMHNVTSILIMTPIVIRLCDSYGVPSRWILCGALVASNLGGFSTRWGDTPNIIEAATWGLSAGDFFLEVMPANLIVLGSLAVVVNYLTQRTLANMSPGQSPYGAMKTIDIAKGAAGWEEAKENLEVDKRLLWSGLGTLGLFVVLHVVFDDYKICIGALTILAAVMLDRKAHRFETIKSLGYDVYLAFAAIFVMAGCFEYSWVGAQLREQIVNTQAAPWAIAITGYLGTMFTEAASWATAASSQIFGLGDPTKEGIEAARTHAAAWALGGGICAGSSSLVTAASAGVILVEESGRFRDERHAITFRKYLPFGVAFSLFMLVFYATYFSVFRY
ncbi:MAG TPA: SLC13 family permease [Pirellulaceae bacterium]|nr:SLC13 family permease [Pirellulaceae bacterium]